MEQSMFIDRGEILAAWLVAGLALAVIGLVPPMALRDVAPAAAVIDVGTLRSQLGPGAVADSMPLVYDAADFAEWLARRHDAGLAAGVIDADS